MANDHKFDDTIRRILESLPRDIADGQSDLRRNLRAGLQSALGRLDLVTREDFEVQAELLARTRRKLDMLERRLLELEARDGAPGDAGTGETALGAVDHDKQD